MIYTDGMKSAILCHGENTNIIYKQQRYRPITVVASAQTALNTRQKTTEVYHRTENEFLWLR